MNGNTSDIEEIILLSSPHKHPVCGARLALVGKDSFQKLPRKKALWQPLKVLQFCFLFSYGYLVSITIAS